ncbi:hypothetical protein ACJX0J_016560, partial [Zea mays]
TLTIGHTILQFFVTSRRGFSLFANTTITEGLTCAKIDVRVSLTFYSHFCQELKSQYEPSYLCLLITPLPGHIRGKYHWKRTSNNPQHLRDAEKDGKQHNVTHDSGVYRTIFSWFMSKVFFFFLLVFLFQVPCFSPELIDIVHIGTFEFKWGFDEGQHETMKEKKHDVTLCLLTLDDIVKEWFNNEEIKKKVEDISFMHNVPCIRKMDQYLLN